MRSRLLLFVLLSICSQAPAVALGFELPTPLLAEADEVIK